MGCGVKNTFRNWNLTSKQHSTIQNPNEFSIQAPNPYPISLEATHLSCQHDVCGSLDTIDKGLPAAVEVVELGLGDGVIDVDGWDLELALLEHAVQVVDTGGSLLAHSLDSWTNVNYDFMSNQLERWMTFLTINVCIWSGIQMYIRIPDRLQTRKEIDHLNTKLVRYSNTY